MEKFTDIFMIPLGWVLKFCYSIVPNYAVALLFFAIFIKLLMTPLTIKQHNNSLKQARLRPYDLALAKKYKNRTDRDSQLKRQEEQQRIYEKEHYSPFAGCLPMLIQLPIIICIFNVVKQPLRYICGFSSKVVKLITDKAGNPDEIKALSAMKANFSEYAGLDESIAAYGADKLPSFDLFGMNLADEPSKVMGWLIIIPILTFILSFISMKLTRKFSYTPPTAADPETGDTAMSLKIMDIAMPALSTYFAAVLPGVIGIYWLYQTILNPVAQIIMVKIKPFPTFTEEEYKEADRIVNGRKLSKRQRKKLAEERKNRDPDRPRVRSLHHIDDDEYNEKVVETEEERKKREEEAKKDMGSTDLLTPFPMKDYSDKDKNKK